MSQLQFDKSVLDAFSPESRERFDLKMNALRGPFAPQRPEQTPRVFTANRARKDGGSKGRHFGTLFRSFYYETNPIGRIGLEIKKGVTRGGFPVDPEFSPTQFILDHKLHRDMPGTMFQKFVDGKYDSASSEDELLFLFGFDQMELDFQDELAEASFGAQLLVGLPAAFADPLTYLGGSVLKLGKAGLALKASLGAGKGAVTKASANLLVRQGVAGTLQELIDEAGVAALSDQRDFNFTMKGVMTSFFTNAMVGTFFDAFLIQGGRMRGEMRANRLLKKQATEAAAGRVSGDQLSQRVTDIETPQRALPGRTQDIGRTESKTTPDVGDSPDLAVRLDDGSIRSSEDAVDIDDLIDLERLDPLAVRERGTIGESGEFVMEKPAADSLSPEAIAPEEVIEGVTPEFAQKITRKSIQTQVEEKVPFLTDPDRAGQGIVPDKTKIALGELERGTGHEQYLGEVFEQLKNDELRVDEVGDLMELDPRDLEVGDEFDIGNRGVIVTKKTAAGVTVEVERPNPNAGLEDFGDIGPQIREMEIRNGEKLAANGDSFVRRPPEVGEAAAPAGGETEIGRQVGELYDEALGDRNVKRKIEQGPVTEREALRIEEAVADKGGSLNLDIRAAVHTISSDAIRHADKFHGEGRPGVPKGMGITREDFQRLSEWTDTADTVELSGDKSRKTKLQVIVSTKRINGTVIIKEEVRTGKGELALKTIKKENAGVVTGIPAAAESVSLTPEARSGEGSIGAPEPEVKGDAPDIGDAPAVIERVTARRTPNAPPSKAPVKVASSGGDIRTIRILQEELEQLAGASVRDDFVQLYERTRDAGLERGAFTTGSGTIDLPSLISAMRKKFPRDTERILDKSPELAQKFRSSVGAAMNKDLAEQIAKSADGRLPARDMGEIADALDAAKDAPIPPENLDPPDLSDRLPTRDEVNGAAREMGLWLDNTEQRQGYSLAEQYEQDWSQVVDDATPDSPFNDTPELGREVLAIPDDLDNLPPLDVTRQFNRRGPVSEADISDIETGERVPLDFEDTIPLVPADITDSRTRKIVAGLLGVPGTLEDNAAKWISGRSVTPKKSFANSQLGPIRVLTQVLLDSDIPVRGLLKAESGVFRGETLEAAVTRGEHRSAQTGPAFEDLVDMVATVGRENATGANRAGRGVFAVREKVRPRLKELIGAEPILVGEDGVRTNQAEVRRQLAEIAGTESEEGLDRIMGAYEKYQKTFEQFAEDVRAQIGDREIIIDEQQVPKEAPQPVGETDIVYEFGGRQIPLTFARDVDRVAYLLDTAKVKKNDFQQEIFRDFIKQSTKLKSKKKIGELTESIRKQLFKMAGDAPEGTALKVPAQAAPLRDFTGLKTVTRKVSAARQSFVIDLAKIRSWVDDQVGRLEIAEQAEVGDAFKDRMAAQVVDELLAADPTTVGRDIQSVKALVEVGFTRKGGKPGGAGEPGAADLDEIVRQIGWSGGVRYEQARLVNGKGFGSVDLPGEGTGVYDLDQFLLRDTKETGRELTARMNEALTQDYLAVVGRQLREADPKGMEGRKFDTVADLEVALTDLESYLTDHVKKNARQLGPRRERRESLVTQDMMTLLREMAGAVSHGDPENAFVASASRNMINMAAGTGLGHSSLSTLPEMAQTWVQAMARNGMRSMLAPLDTIQKMYKQLDPEVRDQVRNLFEGIPGASEKQRPRRLTKYGFKDKEFDPGSLEEQSSHLLERSFQEGVEGSKKVMSRIIANKGKVGKADAVDIGEAALHLNGEVLMRKIEIFTGGIANFVTSGEGMGFLPRIFTAPVKLTSLQQATVWNRSWGFMNTNRWFMRNLDNGRWLAIDERIKAGESIESIARDLKEDPLDIVTMRSKLTATDLRELKVMINDPASHAEVGGMKLFLGEFREMTPRRRRAIQKWQGLMDLWVRRDSTVEPTKLDRPVGARNTIGGLFWQFASFPLATLNQFTRRSQLRGPGRTANMLMGMMLATGFAVVIRDLIKNGNLDRTKKLWRETPMLAVTDLVNRSGWIGLLERPLQFGLDAMSGNPLRSQRSLEFQTIPPGVRWVFDMSRNGISLLGRDKLSASERRRVRRMLVAPNMLAFKLLMRALDALDFAGVDAAGDLRELGEGPKR